jgi:hypothetical protein
MYVSHNNCSPLITRGGPWAGVIENPSLLYKKESGICFLQKTSKAMDSDPQENIA